MQNSSKNLFGAILLFILLDLSALAINYWIAFEISRDAVAINLSGRQRMLSQSITKSLLMIGPQNSAQQNQAIQEEFRNSVRIFDQTLYAFKRGGSAIGGDGFKVTLNRVRTEKVRNLMDQAILIWEPMHNSMLPYISTSADIPPAIISQARNQMVRDNLQLLNLMNQLTSDLENNSLQRANVLRIVQATVFLLSLINFVMIVRRYSLLARQSAQASRHYNELAMRDPLTGLFNRRQLENNLEREVAAVNRRPHSNIALVMIDLDGFKPINDQYGHEIGDQVLRTVAKRLTDGARVNDTIARIGGDEFTLICPDLHSRGNANLFCQRLLDAINQPIPTDAGEVLVGASIGIAFYPDHAENVDDLIRVADKTMYAAKNAGRNCYYCFDPVHNEVIHK